MPIGRLIKGLKGSEGLPQEGYKHVDGGLFFGKVGSRDLNVNVDEFFEV